MNTLDPDVEPTAADEKRMENIARELKQFEPELLRDSTN